MIVASHQPAFLPWPGFWHKLMPCDKFVLSAGVQWANDGFLNRIRYNGGWLTIPVRVRDDDPIWEARVADDLRLLSKAQKTIAQVLASKKRYPYLERVGWLFDLMQAYKPGDRLAEVNVQAIIRIARELKWRGDFVLDATYKEAGETKLDRLQSRLQRCAPEMTTYVMGAGATSYYDSSAMRVPVLVQDPSGFSGEVSIIDVLAGEPDPVDYLMTHGRWQGGEDAQGRTIAGVRTAH